MIFLSFNCRGLASPAKGLALRKLFSSSLSDIICLQETHGIVDLVTSSLTSLLPGWIIHVIDATGRSGGLALCYDPRRIKPINLWGKENVLGMEAFSESLGLHINIVNVYCPYTNIQDF